MLLLRSWRSDAHHVVKHPHNGEEKLHTRLQVKGDRLHIGPQATGHRLQQEHKKVMRIANPNQPG